MFEYMETLGISQADELRKTIQDLFRQTCILKIKYDPVTLVPRDNPRYEICSQHRNFISDYLSVLGCELIHDPVDCVFRISGEGAVTKNLNLITTKLVLIMKIIYKDKIMGEGLMATVTTKSEIRKYGSDTNLITKKLTAAQWHNAFMVMKTHQMIEIPGAIGNLEDDTPIYIYNTVNILCPTNEINELVNEYSSEVEDIDAELEFDADDIDDTEDLAENIAEEE